MKLKLKAKKREILGKKVSNIRKQGGIPAVIYGHSFESIPLEVTLQEFRTILKEAGETTNIDLEIEFAGAPEQLALSLAQQGLTLEQGENGQAWTIALTGLASVERRD